MKKLYLFIGRTASGKTALAKAFCERHGLTQVISYTTRPMRKGELDHTDHIFIGPDDVDGYRSDMAAYTKIGEYEYFATWDILEHSDVYVIDPIGYADLLKRAEEEGKAISLIPVYISISDETQKERSCMRGDDPEVYVKRLESEKEQFDTFERILPGIPKAVCIDNNGPMEDSLVELERAIIDLGGKE